MYDIMTQAKNAIQAYNEALSAVSNNIANLGTNGFKRTEVSFQSIFDDILNRGTSAQWNSNLGGTNPVQLGQGMTISSTLLDMTQGSFTTGGNLDLAIDGQGFFVVSPDGNSQQYTRTGSFQVDANGNLVTDTGMQVYGFFNGDTGSLVPISGLSKYDSTSLSFDASGKLISNASGQTLDTGYSIALTYFANASGLIPGQGTTFTASLASGQAQNAVASGGVAGTIQAQKLEASNADYSIESINSNELNKYMQSNLSVFKMASDIISNFISKLSA